jgi:hypothetical protein
VRRTLGSKSNRNSPTPLLEIAIEVGKFDTHGTAGFTRRHRPGRFGSCMCWTGCSTPTRPSAGRRCAILSMRRRKSSRRAPLAWRNFDFSSNNELELSAKQIHLGQIDSVIALSESPEIP